MASASIVIEQSGVAGAASTSRDDIATGSPVTLRNANDEGVRSWRWTIKLPKGSTATLSNVTAAAPFFTPDVPGTYVVSLAINEGATGQTDRRLAAVRNSPVTIGATTYETRYIGIGEDAEANWIVDLGAGPVTNTTGWWEDLDRWQRVIQAAAGGAFDNRASPENTGSISSGGGTGTGTIAISLAKGTQQFLRVTASAVTDGRIKFYADAARTKLIYEAPAAASPDHDFTSAFVDRTPAYLLADDGTDLESDSIYYEITNSGGSAASFDITLIVTG